MGNCTDVVFWSSQCPTSSSSSASASPVSTFTRTSSSSPTAPRSRTPSPRPSTRSSKLPIASFWSEWSHRFLSYVAGDRLAVGEWKKKHKSYKCLYLHSSGVVAARRWGRTGAAATAFDNKTKTLQTNTYIRSLRATTSFDQAAAVPSLEIHRRFMFLIRLCVNMTNAKPLKSCKLRGDHHLGSPRVPPHT